MGGRAFGEGVADRIPQDVYDKACEYIVDKMTDVLICVDANFDIPRSIGNKSDYGDIDILIGISRPQNFYEDLQLYLGDNILQYSTNGDVSSMLLNFMCLKIQVDFIFVKPEEFRSALNYYSYNDLGCLLGVMARKNDIKLGFDGLSYRMSAVEKGCNLEPLLTGNWEQILSYLGLSIERYNQGFESLEDLFKYVASCRFFNPAFFQFENLNHVNRLRNRKRKTYQSFIDWVNQRHFPEAFKDPQGRHELTFADINKSFPDALLVVHRWSWRQQQQKDLLIKSKFNGNIVMALTNVKGKELGDFIARLKQHSEYERIGLFGTEQEAKELILSLKEKDEAIS